jgi:hypothetical protein
LLALRCVGVKPQQMSPRQFSTIMDAVGMWVCGDDRIEFTAAVNIQPSIIALIALISVFMLFYSNRRFSHPLPCPFGRFIELWIKFSLEQNGRRAAYHSLLHLPLEIQFRALDRRVSDVIALVCLSKTRPTKPTLSAGALHSQYAS